MNSYQDQVWQVVGITMLAFVVLSIIAGAVGVIWAILEDDDSRNAIRAFFKRRMGDLHIVVNVLALLLICAVECTYRVARRIWERSVPDFHNLTEKD